jgi:hypothetical protein
MKSSVFFIATIVFSVPAFAEFNKEETACGFGEWNSAYARAYAGSYANGECDGLPARRISDWKITNYIDSEIGDECTTAEATFSCLGENP